MLRYPAFRERAPAVLLLPGVRDKVPGTIGHPRPLRSCSIRNFVFFLKSGICLRNVLYGWMFVFGNVRGYNVEVYTGDDAREH